jgi:hypothetical protein
MSSNEGKSWGLRLRLELEILRDASESESEFECNARNLPSSAQTTCALGCGMLKDQEQYLPSSPTIPI